MRPPPPPTPYSVTQLAIQTKRTETTSMGMALEDSDDEAKDIDASKKAGGQAASRQESFETDDGNPVRQRDEL